MSLVSTSWLEKNLNKVKILDATWNMPNTKRNALEEYTNEHIRNSIFFDIDRFSKKNTDIPHMLPAEEEWAEIVANLGISNQDRIIIYDNSDVISSCRCWYTFIFFGHEPNLVSVKSSGLIIEFLNSSIFLLSQIGVLTAPGKTVVTFILNSLNSSLKADAKPLNPYFDATYAVEFL